MFLERVISAGVIFVLSNVKVLSARLAGAEESNLSFAFLVDFPWLALAFSARMSLVCEVVMLPEISISSPSLLYPLSSISQT